jgi:hypothetical protein
MRRLSAIALFLCLAPLALAQSQYALITASSIEDLAGNKLQSGTITFTPVETPGSTLPASPHLTGGGRGIATPVTFNITNGVISAISGTAQLVDVTQAVPQYFCYADSIHDNNTGDTWTPDSCVQPAYNASWCTVSGGQTTCDFDNYVPTGTPGVAQVVGPTGPAGPTGPTLIPVGTYSSLATYVAGDMVSYSGANYACITACSGVTPVAGANWELVSYTPISGLAAATQEMVDNFTRANQSGWGNATSGQAWAETGSCNSAIIGDAGTVSQSSFPSNCYNYMDFSTTPDRYSATFSITEVNPSGTTHTTTNSPTLTMITDVLGQSIPVGQAIHVIQGGGSAAPTWWTGASQANGLQFCTSTNNGFTVAANTQYPVAITRQGGWLEIEEIGGGRVACYDPNVATNWPSGGATGIWQIGQESTDVYQPLVTAAEADVTPYNFLKGQFEFTGGLQGTAIGTVTPSPIGIFNSLFLKSQDASMQAGTAMFHIYNDQSGFPDSFTVESTANADVRIKSDTNGIPPCAYFDQVTVVEFKICGVGAAPGAVFDVNGVPWLSFYYTGQLVSSQPLLAPAYEWQGTLASNDYWESQVSEPGGGETILSYTYTGAATHLYVNYPAGTIVQAGGLNLQGGGGAATTCWNTDGTTTACGGSFSGGLGIGYQDVTEIAAPSDPASGNERLYSNSTTHQLSCVTSSGGNCMPGLPIGGGTMTGPLYTATEYSNGTCTTAATIAAANGNRQKITLTNGDTCALTFTQPSSGTASITLKIIQSSTSSYNGGISGCKWPGGTVPTITATSAAVDFVSVYLDGTNAYCVASQNFQ